MGSKENFCYYPFFQMLLEPTGKIHPCCWNQKYFLGDIASKSLEEIWNDKPMQELRQEFLSGKPKSCQSQMKHLRCHLSSLRDFTDNLPTEIVQKISPLRLDLRLNGQCNLECVMCEVWKQPNGTYTEDNFWSYGRETLFPFLKEIILLGGEPFIQKDTFRLVREVSELNADCNWSFVTNGHYLLNDKLRGALDSIKIRAVQLSLDSLDAKTYAQIRKRGELKKPLATLQKWIEYNSERRTQNREFQLIISMAVQKSNFHEIENFLKFGRMLSIGISFQFVEEPLSQSLLSLASDQKLRILDQLLTLQDQMKATELHAIISPLQNSKSS